MAEVLFISPQELTKSTILSGNTDIDKYLFVILSVQITVIEPLVGTELYNKLLSDFESDSLAGLYLDLMNKFIKPITKHQALAEFIETAQYIVDNGGIYKKTGDNVEVVQKDEVLYLSSKYRNVAQMYIDRFEKWICNNMIPEYSTHQEEVNAINNSQVNFGLFL